MVGIGQKPSWTPVNLAQEDHVEVPRPDPVLAFFQTDVVFFQSIHQKEQLVLEADRARTWHAFDLVVTGILEHRKPGGIRAH